MTDLLLPALTLPASGGASVNLADYATRKVLIYFYPKDDTPGCTLEGQDFSRLYGQFQALGVTVFGVSKDSVKSHDKFCQKFGFPFALLSDADQALHLALGAWVEKSMYGKKYMGTDRSTFYFDQGQCLQAWRNVKAAGHAEAVLESIQKAT
jgi:peroxiredoxin